jgi:hypothetical protein
MTFTRGWIAGLLVVPFVFGISAEAAQRPTDSTDALFGADRPPDVSRAMDLTLSVSHARDDDLGADQGAASPIEQRVSGSYSDLSARLSAGLKHKRITFGSHAYGLLRHYPGLDNFIGSNFSARTDLAIALGRRTSFSTAADANSASNFAFDTFNRQTRVRVDQDRQSLSGLDETSAVRQMGLDWTSRSYGAWGNLTRVLSGRQSFSLMTEVRRTEGPILESRTDEYLVMAQLRHTTGQGAFVQFEYRFRQGAQELMTERSPFQTHDALARVERQWRHSRLGRTGMSLAGGPSYLQQRATDAGIGALATLFKPDAHAQTLRAVGTAIVTHDFNNRWNAQMSIRRGVGLGQAGLYSTMAILDVRGAFGPRVGVDLRAGHTDGDIGPMGGHTRDEDSFAASQLQVALSQSVAVYGQYFFYHYVLAGSRLNRGGFRVGISFWAPLWRAVTA